MPTLLRNALLINATFSALCGAAMLIAPQTVGAWTGLELPWLYQVMGAGLGLFAILLVMLATRRPPALPLVRLATWADFGWVAGTVLLLLSPWRELFSERGLWTLVSVAQMVLLCGVLQALGTRLQPQPGRTAQ